MLLQSLYKWTWLAIEFLINIYELCWLLLVVLRSLLLRSYDSICCNRSSIEHREFTLLESRCAQLSKKPRHIAVIVGETARFVDVNLLQRLCKYALHLQINCISIYNASALKNGEKTVLAQIPAPPYAERETMSEQHARWTIKSVNGTKLLKNGINGHKNGTCTPHLQSIEIFEFTPRDNYKSLVELCRDLFNKRDTKEVEELLKKRDNLTHYIDDSLTQQLFAKEGRYFAEPELCIVFSRDFCTYGMLPWHTRFTEFYHFKTGAGFDATQFAKVLCKYSRCEQRWGK